MASMWFTGIENVATLGRDLGEASLSTVIKASQLVKKTAFDIERDAKALVPVDTGNLKSSITTTRTGVLSAVIGPTANYGAHVEWGTSRMAPQPYMGPSTDRNRTVFERACDDLGGSILGGG